MVKSQPEKEGFFQIAQATSSRFFNPKMTPQNVFVEVHAACCLRVTRLGSVSSLNPDLTLTKPQSL